MGGGNGRTRGYDKQLQGLSPRGRGKRPVCHFGISTAGSIPAWAGETGRVLLCYTFGEVYPRVGGGNGNADGPAL